jgi:hypothetical protein
MLANESGFGWKDPRHFRDKNVVVITSEKCLFIQLKMLSWIGHVARVMMSENLYTWGNVLRSGHLEN